MSSFFFPFSVPIAGARRAEFERRPGATRA
jgi:hypothetical protein